MANASGNSICDFGKDQPRLRTSPPYPGASKGLCMGLSPAQKIIKRIREQRKDIFLVGFKATAGESPQETYKAGLTLLKQSSCNLVFANDVQNHHNMVVTPEEFPYHDKSRRASVQTLATMIAARTKLDFASTIMVDDAMASPLLLHEKGAIPQNFVPVLKHLIERGAFKPFLGKTSGHFGCKILDSDYIYRRISSVRKVDHNKVFEEGMARIFEARDERRGDQSIRAGGRKPSVGEHTQALIYAKLGDAVHSIVHFHCPMREQTNLGRDTIINIASQKEFECGSVQCGENTALNMRMIAHGVWAVHLDGHGPNIAFHKNVSAVHILGLINQYWDLSDKTGGKII